MTIHTVKEKGGVFYFFSVKPDAFALGVYSIIMSFLGANLLWVYALLLCMYLDPVNLGHTIERLIGVQIIFACITSFLWWMIYTERGRSVVTHVVFYIWFGAKVMAAMLEVLFFPQFYFRIFHDSMPVDLNKIVANMAWGALVVMVVELIGLYYAQKHFKDAGAHRKPSVGKAYIDKAFDV